VADNSISLNKYISSTGLCSRRQADRLIEEGRVEINGQTAIKGNRVYPKDEVIVDGQYLKKKKVKSIYIALHKPSGIVCTTDQKEKDNIIDFVNHPKRIFPIGRLDKLSTGLIFLTNDGDIVNEILRVENNHEKEYTVTVDKPVTQEFIRRMSHGIPILGKVTKKCEVRQISKKAFQITLKQGLNRQIRRMCEYLDYHVVSLKRVRILNVKLGQLKEGSWRNLSEDELSTMRSWLRK